jgi:hypothetical protein
MFSWLTLTGIGGNKWLAFIFFFLTEFYSTVSDLFLDALVIERLKRQSLSSVSKLQTLCATFDVLGSLISGWMSGYVMGNLGIRGIFVLTSSLPLVTALLSFALKEPPSKTRLPPSNGDPLFPLKQNSSSSSLRFVFLIILTFILGPISGIVVRVSAVYGEMTKMTSAFLRPAVWKPATFMLLWQMIPTLEVGMFFFVSHELKLTPVALSEMEFSVKIASLAGLNSFSFSLLVTLLYDNPYSFLQDFGSLIISSLLFPCRSYSQEQHFLQVS